MPNRELPRGSRSRDVIVRFSHIDAAGIVFYPRYIEMLAQAFPELAPANAPFTLEINFLKPTALGARLTLTIDASAPQADWRLSGVAGGEEQFTMVWQPGTDAPLQPEDHDPGRPAFRSDAMRVGAWAARPDAQLQVSRYYEFVNSAIEQWFENELGLSFSKLHADRAGIPTVSLRTRCAELPRLGEEIRIWIRPTRIGSRSVRFESWLVSDRGCLAKTSQVIVFVRLEQHGFRSAPLPQALRPRLLRHLAHTKPE
ncbi:MAG: thioesterase family protein [Woeseia sp.]